MQVKSLTVLGKGKYEVLFDNNVKIIVSEDFVVKHRLVKGKELTSKEFKGIENELKYSTYYLRCLKYACSYSKSKYEYGKYLERIETPTEYIPLILEELEVKKYIDDRRYARDATRHFLNQGYGKRLIVYRLKEAMVDFLLIEEAISEIDEDEYFVVVKQLAEKRMKKSNIESYKERQKLVAYMYNKGFDISLINAAIEQINR